MKKKDSIENSIRKYFHIIVPISLIYELEELEEIKKTDLEELLSDYGLINHSAFFEELSKWLPAYLDLKLYNKYYMKGIESSHNETLSLIHLSESMKSNQIERIEIKFTLKGIPLKENKRKISISNPDILEEIGEIIYSRFVEERIQEGLSSKEVIFHEFKKGKPKGRPKSAIHQAFFSFGLLEYLNNETELKSGSNFISNDQGKFIYDFLEFSDLLTIDSSKVLKEEYIRTLLFNYKEKYQYHINK